MRNYFLNFDINQGLKRFWPAILFSVLGSLTAVFLIDFEGDFNSIPVKMILSSWIGMLGFINFQLLKERYKLNLIKSLILATGILLIVLAVYLMLPSHEKLYNIGVGYRYLGLIIILHLLVSFVPFIRREDISSFWQYNRKILALFTEALFNSLALYIGLILALLALDFLFNVNIKGELYLKTFIVILGVFNTVYFLSRFPKSEEVVELNEPSKGYTVFSQFILIPLNIIYLIILYAYGVKILLQQSLPKGWVSNLVLWFSVLGILAYLLNYFNTKFTTNPLVHYFKKWFYFLLPAPLIMLFVAIYKRIGDYGLTEHRYIVALLGVWLFFLCIYFIISKKDDIRIIPSSLLLFVLFGLFGPWSFEGASKASQQKRLLLMLENSGLFDGSAFYPSDQLLNNQKTGRIIQKMKYLEKKDQLHFLNDFEPLRSSSRLIKSRKELINAAKDSLNYNLGTKRMRSLLNISDVGYNKGRVNNQHFNFNANFNDSYLDIGEYQRAVYFQTYRHESNRGKNTVLEIIEEGNILKFDIDGVAFEISSEQLLRKHVDFELNRQFDGFELYTDFVNAKIKAQIYFQTIDGELTDEKIKVNYANGLAVYTILSNE